MKNLKFNTLFAKIGSLVGILLFLELVVVSVAVYQAKEILKELTFTTKVQVPATNYAGTVDMLHDGLRAVVIDALYNQSIKNKDSLTEFMNEADEKKNQFVEEFNLLSQLSLNKSTLDKIEYLKPHILEYGNLAVATISLINENQPDKVNNSLKSFNTKFLFLESELGKFRTLMTENALINNESGREIVKVIVYLSSLAILLSFVFTFFLFRHIRSDLTSKIDNVSEIVNKTNQLSESLNNEALNITQSTQEQAAAIQESVSALSEMSSMISQTSFNTKSSYDNSENILQKTNEGMQIMTQLSNSMQSIQ